MQIDSYSSAIATLKSYVPLPSNYSVNRAAEAPVKLRIAALTTSVSMVKLMPPEYHIAGDLRLPQALGWPKESDVTKSWWRWPSIGMRRRGRRLEVDPSLCVFRKIWAVTDGELDGSNRNAIQA